MCLRCPKCLLYGLHALLLCLQSTIVPRPRSLTTVLGGVTTAEVSVTAWGAKCDHKEKMPIAFRQGCHEPSSLAPLCSASSARCCHLVQNVGGLHGVISRREA
jgi:hypothetical protein